jgi:hypothetical protein
VHGNEAVIWEEVHRERPDLIYDTPEYDDYLREKAIHLIERHPLYYAELVARRVLLSTVGEYESGWMHANGESPFIYRTRTGRGLVSYVINRPFNVLEDALQPLVFVLAMLALILTWRDRRREHAVLVAIVLATLVPYWIIHSETRYVLPASLGIHHLDFGWRGRALGARPGASPRPLRARVHDEMAFEGAAVDAARFRRSEVFVPRASAQCRRLLEGVRSAVLDEDRMAV